VSRASFAHALSCLLLSTLVFSATFGAVHSHGTEAPCRAAPFAGGVNFVAPADGGGPSGENPLESKDCSICQLHRNLSGGLLYGPVFTPAPPAQHSVSSVISVPYASVSATPRRGRAPPPTSL
jgi:hypothetical protein